ncbi:MAG TPA: hypothetical protein VKU87_01895 [Thermomicrobiaceae bacterium]|nr:hypothetical protein [Thermomicrobiaceae bacterium]
MDSLAVPATDQPDQSERSVQPEHSAAAERPGDVTAPPLTESRSPGNVRGPARPSETLPATEYDGRVLTGIVIGLVLAVGLLSLGGAFFGGLGALLLVAVYAALVVNDWHGFTGFLSLSRWPRRSGTTLPLYAGQVALSTIAVLLLAAIYPIIGAVRYAEGYVAEKRP